jgi:DNA-binding LacI/PurR family transcriptional regulator
MNWPLKKLVHFHAAIIKVDLHPCDLGYLATSLLIENITGQNSKKTKILVPADLIIIESS